MSSKYKTLIITKDKQAFHKETPLVLLGKWCNPDYSFDSKISDIEYVNNPLSDNNDREKYYYNIQKITDQLLIKMSKVLNTYHNIEFSNKDWKILLGNYVLTLSHSTYIQWLLIQNALQIKNIGTVRVPIINNHDSFIPRDAIHLGSLLSYDIFYAYLIKEIIIKSDINIKIKEFEIDDSSKPIYSLNSTFMKKIFYKSANFLGKIFLKYGYHPKILFFKSYIDKASEAKLNLKLGQIPFIHPFEELDIKESANLNLRSKLKSNNYNGYDKILYELLWEFLPICFLEGFSLVFKQISEQTKNFNPNLIVTSNVGIMQDYPLLFYLVSKKEKRPKIISLQHGGRYGTAKYNCVEEYEVDASDYFFSWGWKSKDNVIPSIMHKSFGNKIRDKKIGSYLIYLPYNTARIPKRITTSISVTGVEKQYERDIIFFNNIDSKIKKMMRIRYHKHGWQNKLAYGNSVSNFNESKKTYLKDNERARITVSTCCSTTILESLAYNIPTVSFFDKDADRLNENASKLFNMLVDVNILHYDPLTASNFINTIWDDVETWWYSKDVVKVKKIFVKEFANVTEKPIDYFFSQLIQLYNDQNSKI